MLPFPDGASISTGSALPDKDIFLNRECAQAKGGFHPQAEDPENPRENDITLKNTLTWRNDNNQTAIAQTNLISVSAFVATSQANKRH